MKDPNIYSYFCLGFPLFETNHYFVGLLSCLFYVIASSTTEDNNHTVIRSRKASGDVNEWTIEEVISFLSDTDTNLGQHAELFRKHVRHQM